MEHDYFKSSSRKKWVGVYPLAGKILKILPEDFGKNIPTRFLAEFDKLTLI